MKKVNTISTEEDFNNYKNILNENIDIYKKYLKKDAKILDIGIKSILEYNIVGVDKDKEIIDSTTNNGNKFEKSSESKKLNIFDIDKEFGKDSFDACISNGLLEYFSKDKIRDIIDKQLILAPIVIASFLLRTKRTLRHYDVKMVNEKEVCSDKINRNLWSEHQWKEDILEFYDVEERHIKKCSSSRGNFDEMIVVIKRDYTGDEFKGLVDEPDKENREVELFTGSYGWNEKLAAFELYFRSCFEFPFKANFRSNEYGDKNDIFTVLRITCCRDKGGVFCEIRFDEGVRKEVPVYSIIPLDKEHKRNIALDDYIEWLPFKV